MSKIKVKLSDGSTVEVEATALELPEGHHLITPGSVPEGFVTKSAMETTIQDRVATAKKNARTELVDDKDFQKGVLSKFGIQLGDDGKPVGIKTTDDIEQVKRSLADQYKSEYEPKLQDLQGKLKAQTSKIVQAEVRNAAIQAGVKKSLLDYVVTAHAGQFDVDEKTGKVALRDDNGFVINPGASDGSYQGPGEFFQKWKAAPERAELFEDNRPGSSGYQGGGGGKGAVTISVADARDYQKLAAAREQAAKSNAELQITE